MVERVLVALGPSNIGDALLCLPALRASAKQAEAARIVLYLGPRAFEALDGLIGGVETLRVERPKGLGGWLALARKIRGLKAVALVDFRRSALPVLVFPWRLRSWKRALGALWPVDHRQHSAVRAFHLAGVLPVMDGAPPEAYGLVAPEPESSDFSRRLEKDGRPLAVMQLGASHPPKRYPTPQFQTVAEGLETKGYRIAWTGVLPVEELPKGLPADHLNYINATTFRELTAILARAALVVSNDGGPMHLAAALGVPVLGLFGQTDHRAYGPFSPTAASLQSPSACSPCNTAVCRFGEPFCLTDLKPGQVLAAAETIR